MQTNRFRIGRSCMGFYIWQQRQSCILPCLDIDFCRAVHGSGYLPISVLLSCNKTIGDAAEQSGFSSWLYKDGTEPNEKGLRDKEDKNTEQDTQYFSFEGDTATYYNNYYRVLYFKHGIIKNGT